MVHPEQSNHFLKDLEEPVNRFLQVPIAGVFVNLLKKTGVTPNQVTYTSVLFGIWSGYMFSRGSISAMVLGGVLLEITLILDCVDGQLARATGRTSEWGRLLDGIAGYFAYGAVVIGIMVGLEGYYGVLAVIAGFTILRAISYDYCKQSMTTMVRSGYDGNKREILNTFQKLRIKKSVVLRIYFYYLQLQQLIFLGRWVSITRFNKDKRNIFEESLLSKEQQKKYYEKARVLMVVWKWNGLDLPLFLIAFFAVFGVIEIYLTPMAYIMGVQYLLTLVLHHLLLPNENFS
ncbi:MAG: CDP-alcohol phosphatidyltransferase family protein [Nitrospinota bacterium]|nr:CDP-alcohol phosphatidyltransferase family protein [Nitrospinota bacterium]